MSKKYNICGRSIRGIRIAEKQLSALFADMSADCRIDHGNDAAAWRESFHNWKDGLHRDGLICDAAVNDLCPIGAKFGKGN